MTKENIEKISVPQTFWSVDEISVDEKKRLADFLGKKGFTISTFYLRFFRNGFSFWEIIGIKECKRQFLLMPSVSELLLNHKDEKDDAGDKGYFYILAKSDSPGNFYETLKKVNRGLCVKLFEFMAERGMSMSTVIKRFSADNWKAWEEEGIHTLLCHFIKNQKSDNND